MHTVTNNHPKRIIMDRKTLREVAWLGDEDLEGPVRGILLRFHGLGMTAAKESNDETEKELAAAGYLVVFPYAGPWNWANRMARRLTNDIVASIFREWDLPEGTPVAALGGSMGGQCALIHARYAEKPVAGVALKQPVCDMKFHYTERPDLPRSMRNAFYDYPEYPDMETILTEQSPLAQADRLPDIPYFFVHGANDVRVNRARHSDVMASALRDRGRQVTYVSLEDLPHGAPVPLEVEKQITNFFLGLLG